MKNHLMPQNPSLLKSKILLYNKFLRHNLHTTTSQGVLPKSLHLILSYCFINSLFFFFSKKQVVCQLFRPSLASADVHNKTVTWPKLKDPGMLSIRRPNFLPAYIPCPCWGELVTHATSWLCLQQRKTWEWG